MDEYVNFCISLCEDRKSVGIINSLSIFPDDIQRYILDMFSTRTLSKKIHPIKEDDIFMASHEGYRKFVRRSRSPLGLAINQSMLSTLVRVKQASNSYSSDRNVSINTLIQNYLHFPPSKKFLNLSIYWTILYSSEWPIPSSH